MTKLPFCDFHIAAFLSTYEADARPLDRSLGDYFRAHKSLGAQDRRIIGNTLYGMVRWKNLIDHLCPSPSPLERLQCFRSIHARHADASLPEHVKLGVPQLLFDRLQKQYGLKQARELCRVCNTEAPVAVRANLLKTSREELLNRWKHLSPLPCVLAPAGLFFQKRTSLFSLPEFKEGLFEVQDEGSQIIASRVNPKPGDTVLDFCSGSGGKTLAFAPAMQGRGQIYLHDIRKTALAEAKKRLRRAGIQNAQCLEPLHPQWARLKRKCDRVLIDVPCSGTGTLRRNPDQKWRLDEAMLQRLVETQRAIALEAISYLKPGGSLVYATCSILAEENQDQVNFILNASPLLLEDSPLALLPQEGGMDGFFAALFTMPT